MRRQHDLRRRLLLRQSGGRPTCDRSRRPSARLILGHRTKTLAGAAGRTVFQRCKALLPRLAELAPPAIRTAGPMPSTGTCSTTASAIRKTRKSLLMAPLTPPVMWRGVRRDAGMAVMSGIRPHPVLPGLPRRQAEAIETLLAGNEDDSQSGAQRPTSWKSPKTDDASLRQVPPARRPARYPSPPPVDEARPSSKAKAGCVACHPHPWFYDARKRSTAGLGTGVEYDVPSPGRSLALRTLSASRRRVVAGGDDRRLQPPRTPRQTPPISARTKLADLLVYLKSL